MSLVKLKCLHPYRSNIGEYLPGVIEVDSQLAEFLMRDAPGVFEPYVPETKSGPEPEEKQVKRPAMDKAVKPSRVSRKRG